MQETSRSDLEAQLRVDTIPKASTTSKLNIALYPWQNSPSTRQWGLVVQGLNESAVLTLLSVGFAASGEEVWNLVREQLNSAQIAKHAQTWLSFMLAKTVVGTAKIQQFIAWGDKVNGNQYRIYRVSLQDFKQDTLLTEAFHTPQLLSHETYYIVNNQRFAFDVVEPGKGLKGRDVIVVRKVLDKAKVTLLLTILLILSPSLGIIIGIFTHKAEVGIAVSAAIFALASFLQGLAAWYHA